MKFSELYKDNVSAVKRTLKSMWCRNANTNTQKAYIKQIEELIDSELFASEQYMPLVQCMEQYPSLAIDRRDEVETYMKGLWEKSIFDPNDPQKYFTPYVHQWDAWKALAENNADGIKQSMVVTTGTGSGKTECFMLPLIKDLTTDDIEQPRAKSKGVVEALFLYPLNALMEDQKERLHKLLKDTNLTFASYNGNLPRKYEDNPKTATQIKTNAQIDFERRKYGDTIVATREELWCNPANILMTNPSMLEYMLLRNEDQCLFSPGSLKWIVIDEAHSYSGAGAAELAMLIRRVLQAFSIDDPNKIRFALSSATIGNEDDATKRTEQLLEFISKLTGVNKENITTISADRHPKKKSIQPEIEKCRDILVENDYVKLDDLFPSGTIAARLSQLDAMCNEDGSVDVPLKAKVHFFHRVPNNGLRICLDDISVDGAFTVKSFTPTNAKTPALELMRCEKCGEFFAVAEEVAGNRYCAYTKDGANLFDLSSKKNQILLFALTDKDKIEDGNLLFDVNKDVLTPSAKRDGYNLIANTHMQCPHCDADLGAKKSNKKDNDGEDSGMITDDWQKVRTYRLSAEFISRTLAPSILPHLHKYTPKDGEDEKVILEKPHYGQQYISFVDSRQAAARSTLKQNLAQESAWIYSRLMNKLSDEKQNEEQSRKSWEDAITALENIPNRSGDIEKSIKEYKSKLAAPIHLTWMQAFDYLHSITNEGGKNEAEMLCKLFANKRDDSECNTDNGEILKETKDKYILQAMLDNLGRHSRTDIGQETMGLFTSYYPKLEEIKKVPSAVEEFNEKFDVNIEVGDWKNLIKIFLDYSVRSSEKFYFSDNQCRGIDIKQLRRFATRKQSVRRPVTKHEVNGNGQNAYIITLLAAVIDKDNNSKLSEVAKINKIYIDKVTEALWDDLLNTTQLIKAEPNTNNEEGYLNLTDIAFKVFDKVYLCNSSDKPHLVELRPVDTLFMGYSPYIIDGKVEKPIAESDTYVPYEYINGKKDGGRVTVADIREWSNKHRSILCEHDLWGETGYFTDRLDYIYSYPNIFIQAESTAQVDKTTSRQNQHDFKKQEINIMACSTTMEMGVDLGNMELVLMQSVPPHPTNYKQRAGRSGRNRDTRSVAITLCDSGAAGLRTLLKPLEGLINRPMTIPTVDLNSQKVVRRHINAALLRAFLQDHSAGDEILHGRVINFFSTYVFEEKGVGRDRKNIVRKPDGNEAFPNSGLGDSDDTLYYKFKNWLHSEDVSGLVNKLTEGTYYHNNYNVSDCIEDIERCYNEVAEKIKYYGKAYGDEANAHPDKVRPATGEVDTGYGRLLTRKYYGVLKERLASFFATHRMTPNATMPIAIVSFNHAPKLAWDNRFTLDKPNDPSYTLREALSQYAPGNTVILENKAIVVAGVDYTGIDLNRNEHRTFCTLYTDGSVTAIDNQNILKQKRQWPINNKEELIMVKPIAYNADINATCTRYAEHNPFTHVIAQLVDANEWQESSNPKRMLDMRNNRESGNGCILFANIGIGYGYAFCAMCGKAMAETGPRRQGTTFLPDGFNGENNSHYNIRRLKGNNSKLDCNYKKMIYRNVVIGDTIQTDFCEIMIRKEVDGMWLNGQSEYKTLLTTIGLLISTTFADYLGKDRNDIDFVVMQNGHLCIYDTNPGGSGYSDLLADRGIMRTIINLCTTRINEIKSKDELIDKFSSRYINDIDIDAARIWLQHAMQNYDAVPDAIKAKQPNAQVSYISSLINDIKQKNQATLFVDSNFEKWFSGESYIKSSDEDVALPGWRERIYDIGINQFAKADIIINKTDWIPRPIFYALYYAKGVIGATKVQKITGHSLGEGLYPLAKVGERLYFTDVKDNASLNYAWARGDIYYIDSLPNIATVDVDLTNIPENCKKFTVPKECLPETTCRNLAAGVIDCGGDGVKHLIEEFKNHCKQNSNSGLNICYRDEYLRTPLSMITAIGFIDHFIKALSINPNKIEIIGEQFRPGKKDPYPNDSKDYSDMELETYFKWSNNRDDIFRAICSAAWEYDVTVDSKWRNSLPHWRDLKLECAGKELIIYPNGGIFNGWELKDDNDKLLDMNTIIDAVTDNQDFALKRSDNFSDKELMYDIEFK